MNGVIVLDKPQGFTSFDVVAVARGVTKEKKIGHTGTLDPMATGVLPLLLGRAAKAADLLPDTAKVYRAGFILGEKFDTGDITGRLLESDAISVSREELELALAGFRGEIMQTPPMYSAVSVGGQRLYKLARQGIEVERTARPIIIHALELEEYDPAARRGTLRAACSKGTYIRTLIEDIAAALGTLGAMTALRRTIACGFSEEEAIGLQEFKDLSPDGIAGVLRPVDSLFSGYPQVNVSGPQALRFTNGGGLDTGRLHLPGTAILEGRRIRVYGPESKFLGLGEVSLDRGELRFLKLFAE